MVSIVKPNVHGDANAWGTIVNQALTDLETAHNALEATALKIANYAPGGTAEGGLATVDDGGNVEQDAKAHTHPIVVQDSGSTTYYSGSRLDLYFGAGNIQYDAVSDRIKVLATPADVRTLLLANDITNATTTLSSVVPDLQLNLANANSDVFDVDGIFYFESSAAALVKIQWQVSGSGASMYGLVWGPATSVNNAASDAINAATLRSAIITIPTNGPQQFGGFPASGLGKSWCQFHFRVKAGSAPGNLNIKFAQANSTPGDATKLLANSMFVANRVS